MLKRVKLLVLFKKKCYIPIKNIINQVSLPAFTLLKIIAVQGFQFKGNSYSQHAIISRCLRGLVTHTLHSIQRWSKLGPTRATVQQGHLLSPGILVCCCLPGRTQTLLGCGPWRTHLETSALGSSYTGMDETNGTANTCIYTAPPVGQGEL